MRKLVCKIGFTNYFMASIAAQVISWSQKQFKFFQLLLCENNCFDCFEILIKPAKMGAFQSNFWYFSFRNVFSVYRELHFGSGFTPRCTSLLHALLSWTCSHSCCYVNYVRHCACGHNHLRRLVRAFHWVMMPLSESWFVCVNSFKDRSDDTVEVA